MKILHTKAATEPILLATTCHNMNLFAIVTKSLIVVYRSTTLTVVMTFPLSLNEDERTVSACWSPSGRLLAIGVHSGELYLFDVESGELVRQFSPRSDVAWTINPLEDDSGSNSNEDTMDTDKEKDPLQQPPTLPISVQGAIVACTWTSVALRAPAIHSHKELCLPLRSTVSSSIFEEVEREGETPVLLLLDQKGRLCFLPGGIQEVCVVVVELPWTLDPHRMRVETFLVTTQPSIDRGDDSYGNIWNGVGDGVSHSAYLVVQDTSDKGFPYASSCVVRIYLSDTIAAVTNCEVVTICCIAEYCRMGKISYEFARQRWEKLISAVRSNLLLPQKAVLIRDALVEDIARPCKTELLEYFKKLDLMALVKDAENILQEFSQTVLQLSNVAYRCYDLALHLSQAQFRNRQRQCLLMDVIGGLRQRCSNILHQIRLETERERDLVQWIAQQAALRRKSLPPGTENFILQPPLRAVHHPSLLRTLHRIFNGDFTVLPLVDEEEERKEEEELAYIVNECMLASRGAVACQLQFVGDENVKSILQRQCEVLTTDAAVVDGVQVYVVTVTQEWPTQPFMAFYTFESQDKAGGVLLAQQESIPVEMEPMHFSEADVTFLWCGVVDEKGSCVILWERALGTDVALVLALVKDNGAIDILVDDESENDDDDKEGKNSAYAEEDNKPKYAVVEMKGIYTRHLRASLSRGRGFGVFYAKERFCVVDFYGS